MPGVCRPTRRIHRQRWRVVAVRLKRIDMPAKAGTTTVGQHWRSTDRFGCPVPDSLISHDRSTALCPERAGLLRAMADASAADHCLCTGLLTARLRGRASAKQTRGSAAAVARAQLATRFPRPSCRRRSCPDRAVRGSVQERPSVGRRSGRTGSGRYGRDTATSQGARKLRRFAQLRVQLTSGCRQRQGRVRCA